MSLSDLTHATVEQIDAAIVAEDLGFERLLKDAHTRHLAYKATCRRGHLAALKKLQAYRAIIKLEYQGGGE